MSKLDFLNFFFFNLLLMIATSAAKCPRIRRIKNLRPKYQSNKRLVYFRCKRGFDLIGATSAVCNGNQWSTEYPICIAPGCRPLEFDEDVLDVTYTYRGSLATFQCKASYLMEDKDNRVYCNKVEWNKSPPTCIKNSLKKSCSYEAGICGWTQDKSDEFDWEIHSKETPTKFTGPFNDHTFGNRSEGHYIYIESSAPRRPGDQARLLSPLYNFKSQTACFEFWFHMWCPDETKEVASLEVFIVSENQPIDNGIPLHVLSGDYGKDWNRQKIQIGPIQESFQIALQATRGLNHQNDIAVDDILLWEGQCDDEPNVTFPVLPPTNAVTKAAIPSSSSESQTVGHVTTRKESLTSLLKSTLSKWTTSKTSYGVITNPKTEAVITTQASKSNEISSVSSTTQTNLQEKKTSVIKVNGPERTELTPDKMAETSSLLASVTEAEIQNNVSITQLPNFNGNFSPKSSGGNGKSYTPLAIGITVALLFGIGVIFFIVWIWARNQDRKRANAEDEEETQPITNAGSNASLQNGF